MNSFNAFFPRASAFREKTSALSSFSSVEVLTTFLADCMKQINVKEPHGKSSKYNQKTLDKHYNKIVKLAKRKIRIFRRCRPYTVCFYEQLFLSS